MRLLVAGLVVGQRAAGRELRLQQRLADAGDVAVAEDAEAAGEEPLLARRRARCTGSARNRTSACADGQPDGGHRVPPIASGRTAVAGRPAGSAQVSRTQAWAGSSQIRQARSGPGPAITLR